MKKVLFCFIHRAAYTYCENVINSAEEEYTFEYKSHSPVNTIIQDIAAKLKQEV